VLARVGAFLALVIVLGAAAPVAQQARSPRNASYTIAARLNPSARSLDGEETLRWRNISSRPTETVQLHLYYNAWRDDRSTWMRERALSSPAPEDPPRRADEWGSIDVRSIAAVK
jgi:hypothetical protein